RQNKLFHSRVKPFQDAQRSFRSLWCDRKRTGWQLQDKFTLSFLSEVPVIRVSNLHWFLFLDLVTHEPERLKICGRPDCPAPYFIARHHLGQQYCGSDCASWAQKKWKRQWWARSKEKASVHRQNYSKDEKHE